MTTHTTGTRQDWLTARSACFRAERSSFTERRGGATAQHWRGAHGQGYHFDTDEGSASLLFRGRSQLLV